MTTQAESLKTLADVLDVIAAAALAPTRRRDMVSATRRIAEMAGSSPARLTTDPPALRKTIAEIRPAAHGVSAKTWSTMRSAFGAALQLAGVLDDMGRGRSRRHPAWAPLTGAIKSDKRLANGLAAFANWCAVNEIAPDEVTDETVQRFLAWLEARTLHPRPRDIARGVPNLWNEARTKLETWPKITLTRLSFRPPRKRLDWDALSESFRRDAEAYLALRADPDIFDDSITAPRRPLAPNTLGRQEEHLRLAASILVESGTGVAEITSLADLVQPENFKTVLRHYHSRANGQPNAFAVCVATTLIQAAQYHVGSSADEISELKRLASKLPPVPLDLTAKNKALLCQLESERLRAKLLFLAEDLLGEVAKALAGGALPFVKAQVAIAIDLQLAAALRPQNLCSLNWRRHFQEPDGSKGRLLLHIPAEETKARRKEFTIEIPPEVAQRLRWYRRHILPRLNADPSGYLFVTRTGSSKSQETLSQQITEALAERVGIHMTPHQFRHFGGRSYLEANPEDHQTAQALLGHASPKSTLIYVGSASRRASRAYSAFLFEQRDELKLKRAKTSVRPKRSAKVGSR